MKRLLGLVAALAGVAMLSSCIFNPFSKGPNEHARDRIDQIADAITSQDADALKELFSTRAVDKATDIDAQLEYLFSFFPSGSETSYELSSLDSPKSVRDGMTTELVRAMYRVEVDGEDLWLFFADFTENDPDPDKIGLYGLGVAPRTESRESDVELAMYEWNGQFDLNEGTPGIYVPQP